MFESGAGAGRKLMKYALGEVLDEVEKRRKT
jgi:hypothetical protein